MNEIRITIEGLKELAEAVRALAGVKEGQPGATVSQQAQPGTPGQAFAGVPVQQPQVPVAAPTTAMPQAYTLEQLQVAAAGLTGMGKTPQLMGILQQFGIRAMTELPKERYGVFATALREAGAQI